MLRNTYEYEIVIPPLASHWRARIRHRSTHRLRSIYVFLLLARALRRVDFHSLV